MGTRRPRSDLIRFHEELERFATVRTPEELTQVFGGLARELGFDAFVYALRIPTTLSDARMIVLPGYPESWLAHYFEQAFYVDDPVVAYCREHVVPIPWHALAPRVSDSPAAARVMNEATAFGLRAGLSMPVHSPYGEMGILSVAVDRASNATREQVEHARPFVQLLAGYVHEAVRRVFELGEAREPSKLTAREQECLRWAADGKTSWEIATLLRVSERTVNFHLNNCMAKLDVGNRQHAIAKAVLQGFIRPNPF